MKMRTMLQGFEWNLPANSEHWNRLASQAEELADLGITDIWLPPAYKGIGGDKDVGYAVYDLYDMGEFNAKGSVATKYGTVGQYMDCIAKLHLAGINVLADVVLNHRMGGQLEEVKADVYDRNHPLTGYIESKTILAETSYPYSESGDRYTGKTKNHEDFTGTDVNFKKGDSPQGYLYLFEGRHWSDRVSHENENDDYIMGCDLNFANPDVVRKLKDWGKWYISRFGIDGVRLDAVKHIDYEFYPDWLHAMREHLRQNGIKREFMAVGEYLNGDGEELVKFLDNTGKSMNLFDFALHYNLYKVANKDPYAKKEDRMDLWNVFDNTLVAKEPWYAVTFVDNHDTVPSEDLRSWIDNSFRQSAYALILLRRDGLPCVFYGDLYGVNGCVKNGISYPDIPAVPNIRKLLEARRDFATGEQENYFEKHNLIGWTREGGVAVVISTGGDGKIRMKHGEPGQVFIDILGNSDQEITIEADGHACFTAKCGSVSVWVPKK